MKLLNLLFLILGPIFSNAQEICIENKVTNFSWIGFNNLIEINDQDDCSKLILKTNNGTVTRSNNCTFYFNPSKVGIAKLTVYRTSGNDTIKIGDKILKAKYFPIATSTIGGKSNGTILKKLLLAQNRIDVDVLNFDIDLHYDVISFEILIIKGDKVPFKKEFKGGEFDENLKAEFNNLNKGDALLFFNIKAKDKLNQIQKATNIYFTIE